MRRRSKLKEEFRELPQSSIKEIKNSGREITTTVEIPTIAFTGDTERCEALDSAEFRGARIMISECTFFAPEHRERAKVGKHLHIEDFPSLMQSWEASDVVLTHVSRRTSLGFAHKRIREIFGPDDQNRMRLLMDHKENRRRYERQLEEAEARMASPQAG